MEALVYAIGHVLATVFWLLLGYRTVRAARGCSGPGPLNHDDQLVIGLAALGARAAGIVAFRGTPLFTWPLIDAAYYEDWARGLASGVDLHPVFGVDPLYAHVLGGLYRIFGVSPIVSVLLGCALGLASSLLAHQLCARVASRPIALLVGVAAALHGTVLQYDLLRLKSSLSLALMLALFEAFLAASAKRKPWSTLAPGALLGLGALNGAQALFAVPVLALSLWKRPQGLVRIALLCAPVLVAAGWSYAHNARGGDPVPFHTGSGMILWASNNPAAWGRITPLAYIRQDSRYEVADYTAEAERRTGRTGMRASEATAYWRTQALDFLRANPGRALWLAALKVAQLLDVAEWPDNYNFRLLSWLMPHLALPLPAWDWVIPLALVGIALAFADRPLAPGARVLAASCVLLSVPFVITYSNGRLRLPLLAVAWPLAALALDRVARAPSMARVASVLLLTGAVNVPVAVPPLAPCLVGIAEACRSSGLYNQSMELYALALRSDPDHFGSLNNLGALAMEMGRPDAAVRLFQRAVSVRPRAGAAWYNLGNAWRRSGRPAEALEAYAHVMDGIPAPVLALKRGLALAATAQKAQAREALTGALSALDRDASGTSEEERAEGRAALSSLVP